MADGPLRQEESIEAIEGVTRPIATRRSLPIALLRAREAVMSHFRPMLAEHDITEQQWRVIRVLYEDGMLDASEVAARAFILAPSLTRMIRSMEERGFISKHKDSSDGRRVLLKIAPEGEMIIREVLPDSRKIYQDLEKHFSRERMENLLELLDELASYRNENGGSLQEE
ncbi:homoprotocatechuate degradation operon regulator HpaR [Rhizobium sp.]|jgi:homoprotocatechuate degradation regulator HpaR|uniref:homoprotocatechuate degradation operon regulator HpaR n=1 Tax=Rhizobium sp. TaxID=391 RepID=UPI000E9AD6CA|nr:homoprotocatechuate degradation operon regulator HpaR [Rhizobium sp.]